MYCIKVKTLLWLCKQMKQEECNYSSLHCLLTALHAKCYFSDFSSEFNVGIFPVFSLDEKMEAWFRMLSSPGLTELVHLQIC